MNNQITDICEQEKLHHSGAIQPFAVLLAVDTNGTITHVSANISKMFEIQPDQLLHQHISKLLGKSFDLKAGTPTTLKQRRMTLGAKIAWGKAADICVTDVDTGYLVELQAFRKTSWFGRVKKAATVIIDDITFNYRSDLTDLMHTLARRVRSVSGCDKAMIYKFHGDWSGEVIAEIGGKGSDSYLGLRFPASDIPKIARDIYQKTPYRLIPDATASSVPLISNQSQPLDLTYADSRSVSPIHLTYMQNMPVAASFSLPIIENDQLWGLVALHHQTPNYITLDTCNQCAKLVAKFNTALAMNLSTQRSAVSASITPKINAMMEQFQQAGRSIKTILSVEDDFLELLNASGGVIFLNDEMVRIGITPNDENIRKIDAWFTAQAETSVATDCLETLLPGAAAFAEQAAGLMAVGSKRMRIYWFRVGLPQEIYWAGNPDKLTTTSSEEGISISPRKSFEKWAETTNNRCRAWENTDRITASDFSIALTDMMLK